MGTGGREIACTASVEGGIAGTGRTAEGDMGRMAGVAGVDIVDMSEEHIGGTAEGKERVPRPVVG